MEHVGKGVTDVAGHSVCVLILRLLVAALQPKGYARHMDKRARITNEIWNTKASAL